ncbi:hypothetical protein HXX76_010783 [Chlamydomonas incerta]|uniref:Gem-associated protein 2 n=1 Tax=Chlamydomonas incerta TaxID=51695 RepID=A0A835SM11_CHLIN|nr:hypothetical protein HXX76_010783 [Chlamydomonas incerta]|eukprot:KAG2429548.1 hypothetical protein HXX76_010783 [Chlamydomonas incerta]
MDLEGQPEGYGEEAGEGEEYEGEEEAEGEVMDTDDDEEYNLTHFGISQALPVPEGPPDFSAGPPQTAEEYLQWVRYEAAQCPRVTRKDVDPEKLAPKRQAQNQNPDSADAADGASGPGSSGAAGAAAGVGGVGGGGGGAGRGRRRGTAFAAQVPPPVDAECQEWARPNPKWLTVFLQDFARLRQALAAMRRSHAQELSATELPHLDNLRAWDRLCFEQWQSLEQQQSPGQGRQSGQPAGGAGGGDGQGTTAAAAAAADEDEDEAAGPPPPPPTSPPPAGAGGRSGGGGGGAETDRLCGPVVRTVLAMDQVAVACLLQRHVAQLSALPLPAPPPAPEPLCDAGGSSSNVHSSSSSSSSLTYMRCQWLFALSAVLERPVPPDVSAALRELVRRCSALRSCLARPDDPSLPRLNVLLAVAGGYFGQDEALSSAAAAAGLTDLA